MVSIQDFIAAASLALSFIGVVLSFASSMEARKKVFLAVFSSVFALSLTQAFLFFYNRKQAVEGAERIVAKIDGEIWTLDQMFEELDFPSVEEMNSAMAVLKAKNKVGQRRLILKTEKGDEIRVKGYFLK